MRSLSRVTVVAALLSLAILASSSRGQEGREIARNAFPSVVLVLAEDPKAHRASLGSGFFIQDNLIVTNYHVIKGSSRISVKLVGHKDTYRAQVVATSIPKDLAFIGVVDIQAPPLSFGDLDDVAVGGVACSGLCGGGFADVCVDYRGTHRARVGAVFGHVPAHAQCRALPVVSLSDRLWRDEPAVRSAR